MYRNYTTEANRKRLIHFRGIDTWGGSWSTDKILTPEDLHKFF